MPFYTGCIKMTIRGYICGVILLLSIAILALHIRVRPIDQHGEWMYDKNITLVSVMGYVSLGAQVPVYESQQYFPLNANSINTRAIVRHIRKGDVIVVLRGAIEVLLPLIQPHTPPFTLVSVNSDKDVDMQLQQRIASFNNIVAFYGNNLRSGYFHYKINPLPLGLRFHESKTPIEDEKRILAARKKVFEFKTTKIPKILINMAHVRPGYNGVQRQRYIDALKHKSYVDVILTIPHDVYFETISQYAYVLSPPGEGYGCFRTWEAIASGTIPIVHKDNNYDERLFNGTTVWIVSSPEEIDKTIDSKLKMVSNMTISNFFPEMITLDYWKYKFTYDLTI